jgi:hypothetical protein
MGKWAATRMESLVWEEKVDRIKVFFIHPTTVSKRIAVEHFNTHIRKSVFNGVCSLLPAVTR